MVNINAGSDAELAITAAQAGAAVVRDMFGAPLPRFHPESGDYALNADLESEHTILQLLRSARPEDAVLAEETGRSGPEDTARTWLVDPLCGTLNYAVRHMLVAVNVALRIGSVEVVAASADPFTGEVFWTDGAQARMRGENGDEELVPSSGSRLVDVNLEPPFPNAPGFSAAHLLAEPEFTDFFRPRVVATTLALSWVAAGRRAGYVTDGYPSDRVHFASGLALCRSAGCVVTGLYGQPPHTDTGGIVAAADAETHSALLKMIGRQQPAAV